MTNGTVAGTSELSVTNNVSPDLGLDPQDLVTFGSEVLFLGVNGINIAGLWVTDGTVHGTSELVSYGSSFAPGDLTVFGSEVLFSSSLDFRRPSRSVGDRWDCRRHLRALGRECRHERI